MTQQRFSVPSFLGERWKTSAVLITCFLSILSLMGILYYEQYSLAFSKRLGIEDNLLWMGYMTFTYCYCLITYNLLSKLHVSEAPLCNQYLSVKRFLLCLMSVQCICCKNTLNIDNVGIFLVSYYVPKSGMDDLLLSLLNVSIVINSILFLACQIFFIFSLKYDLFYIGLNLQIRPDTEYFIDLEESTKLTL